MEKIIAIVDIETTGLKYNEELILEIGIVLLNLKTGEIKKIYDEVVKEDGFGEEHKESWVFNNSDLTFEEIIRASPLDNIKIQKIFNKYNATAYNKKFDFDFLKSRGLIINELPCPMIISTDICKLPGFYGNYKYPKVQEAWNFFFGETDYVEKHRGGDDAKHEALIVYELYKRGLFDISKLK